MTSFWNFLTKRTKIKLSPIAYNWHWAGKRGQSEKINDGNFLWELQTGKDTWYIYRDRYGWWSDYHYFPYRDVRAAIKKIYRVGPYHFWKGTYKD